MQQLNADQKKAIAQFMRNRRRQMRTLDPRRYPKAIIDTRTYIEDFNQLNRSPYRQRITLNFQF
jgi:hypothetical protein